LILNQASFRAIIGAAPLKRAENVARKTNGRGFRAIIGAAPLKHKKKGGKEAKDFVSAPSLARLH